MKEKGVAVGTSNQPMPVYDEVFIKLFMITILEKTKKANVYNATECQFRR